MTIDERLREMARQANQRQAITAEEIVQRASCQPTGSLTTRFRFIDRRHVLNHRPVQVSGEEATMLDVETPTSTRTDERRNGPKRVMLGVLAAAAAVIAIAVVAIRKDEPVNSVDQPSSTVTASEAHPIVGTWMMTTAIGLWESHFMGVFSADGNYEQVDLDGAHLGVWESTGPTTAGLTFVIQGPVEGFTQNVQGSSETAIIRATIEVAPDGQSFTGDYTVSGGDAPGGPTGQYGPEQFTGTRVVVEPMGTPVGGIMGRMFFGPEETSEGTTEGTTAPPTTG